MLDVAKNIIQRVLQHAVEVCNWIIITHIYLERNFQNINLEGCNDIIETFKGKFGGLMKSAMEKNLFYRVQKGYSTNSKFSPSICERYIMYMGTNGG